MPVHHGIGTSAVLYRKNGFHNKCGYRYPYAVPVFYTQRNGIRGSQEVAIRRFGKSEDFPEFVAKTKLT
jgi:hypothetical protein